MNHALFDADAVFKINGFGPPAPEHSSMGGWGFGVDLSLKFARKCAAFPIDRATVDRLNESVSSQIVARLFPPETVSFHRSTPTYRFRGESSLLTCVEVPGVNGCILYTDPDDLRDLDQAPPTFDGYEPALSYTTHNVDTIKQASALLSCWIRWVNGMAAGFAQERERQAREFLDANPAT